MPIRGRTPDECFRTFKDHVSKLVADTFGQHHHVTLTRGEDPTYRDLQLGVRARDYVELDSGEHRKIFFSLAQALRARKLDDGSYQLKTLQYWYKVFDVQPGLDDEPLFRWEYVSEVPSGKKWCRHHFQVGRASTGDKRRAVTFPLGEKSVDMNKAHVPTGFVLMEYVFRFLITELDVRPATDDWERFLVASEERFFTEFSIYAPPP